MKHLLIPLSFMIAAASCGDVETRTKRTSALMDEKLEREKALAVANVQQEMIEEYGPDKSKWPQPPKLKSSCERYYVSVMAGGSRTAGNVTIC
ncbi:hypothetical protein AB9K41_18765 [Cribrihabitans sp. XS_ASV171]